MFFVRSVVNLFQAHKIIHSPNLARDGKTQNTKV